MKIFKIALIAAGLITGSTHAADFSFSGNFLHPDEVQPFNFTVVGSAADVTLRTWSHEGGTNAEGTEIASGSFDPVVALFSATTGSKIGEDDQGLILPNGPLTDDAILTENLSPGSYIATLTYYDKFTVGPFLENGFYTSQYSLNNTYWAIDLLNVSGASAGISFISAMGLIPEPETHAMLLAGLGLVAFIARRRKQVS